MNDKWLVSRRALLGGIGAFGLSSMLPRTALAAGEPKRFIVVHVPEGMWSGAPRPAAGANTLGPILGALDPYKAQTMVLNNLNIQSRDRGPGEGTGHQRGVIHMLTGTEMADGSNAGGISVDQKIAGAIGKGTTFASLQFAVRIIYGDGNSRPIWAGARRALPGEQSPWGAYDRIFGNFNPSPTASKLDLRKSALDFSRDEMNRLRGRLSDDDKNRLDSYQESLRSIENRLGALPSAACTKPALGNPLDPRAEQNYPAVGKLQMDLIVAALQCGVTNVASLQWGNSNDQCTYSWLGVNTLGHDLSHNNNNCDPDNSKKLKVYQWYAQQFAYLLGKLKSVPEGTGTMLDNTLVLWASEFGDSNGHVPSRLMWTLMGNLQGRFKTGRVVDCGNRSVNDLHTSLCQAYGIPDASFGNPAYCNGPLPLT